MSCQVPVNIVSKISVSASGGSLSCRTPVNIVLGAISLNSAVYVPNRDVIFGTDFPGHIVKLNATTGAVISDASVFFGSWGDAYITYSPDSDRLYVAKRIQYTDDSYYPDYGLNLFEIHPDTFAVTKTKALSYYGATDLLRLYSFNGSIYMIGKTAATNVHLYRVNPADLTTQANSSISNNSYLGDVAFDPLHLTVIPVFNEYYAPSPGENFQRLSSDLSHTYAQMSRTTTQVAYGVAWSDWNKHAYYATSTRYVMKAVNGETSVVQLDTGRASANAYNIRQNPYTYYLYVANWNDNTVTIIDPRDDSMTLVTGFDRPFDIVFTPSKTFAVQHGRPGLQEVVASLGVIPPPAPEPVFTPAATLLVSYYKFEESGVGPWLDSKGTNHLYAGPGGANGAVNALAIQVDGKIVIGGAFTKVNETSITRIARINNTGNTGLDSTFTPSIAPGTVNALALQADGKVLAGGATSNRLVRLDTVGTQDATWVPAPNNTVRAIAVQADQKVIAGGLFTSIAGVSVNRIVRLNATSQTGVRTASVTAPGTGYTTTTNVGVTGGSGVGATFDITDDGGGGVASVVMNTPGTGYAVSDVLTLNGGGSDATLNVDTLDGLYDTTFKPGTGANGSIFAMAIQPGDGYILIGGAFNGANAYNTTNINRIARIKTDGTIDTLFTPGTGANGNVNAIALQSNGKIIIGGDFTTVNGVTHNRVARLNADGTLDATFVGNISASVTGVAVESGGQVLVVTTSSPSRLDSLGTLLSSGGSFASTSVVLDAGGKAIVGSTSISTASQYGLTRFTPANAGLSGFSGRDWTFNRGPGAISVAGIVGNAAKIDNSATGISVGLMSLDSTDFSLDHTKGFTLCYWEKPTTTGIFNPRLEFIKVSSGGSDFSSTVFNDLIGSAGVTFNDGTFNGETLVPTLTIGAWNFIRMWVDPTNLFLKVQVNNGTILTSTRTLGIYHFSAPQVFRMYPTSLPGRTFTIDELALYEGVLTDAEAAYLWNGGAGKTYPDVPYP